MLKASKWLGSGIGNHNDITITQQQWAILDVDDALQGLRHGQHGDVHELLHVHVEGGVVLADGGRDLGLEGVDALVAVGVDEELATRGRLDGDLCG